MSEKIDIDRFTRMTQSVVGKFAPGNLPRIAETLVGEEGEINYSLSGYLVVDAAGGKERRVKCIIQGWFLLSDPVTLEPVRHTLNISSLLILVRNESELPLLEMESETEDYVVCGAEMNVAERVEEEILLSLPSHAVNRNEMKNLAAMRGQSGLNKAVLSVTTPISQGSERTKISPFAKLASLKNKRQK